MTDLLLPQALLWFDDDSSKSLEDKVRAAAARYRSKHGKPPTLCLVHPAALDSTALTTHIGGVEVRAGRAILPNDFLIGRTSSAEQERLDDLRCHLAAELWQKNVLSLSDLDTDPPDNAKVCHRCGGHGIIVDWSGMEQTAEDCPDCDCRGWSEGHSQNSDK